MDNLTGYGMWILIIVVIIFFIARELTCWYFKINEISAKLTKLIEKE